MRITSRATDQRSDAALDKHARLRGIGHFDDCVGGIPCNGLSQGVDDGGAAAGLDRADAPMPGQHKVASRCTPRPMSLRTACIE